MKKFSANNFKFHGRIIIVSSSILKCDAGHTRNLIAGTFPILRVISKFARYGSSCTERHNLSHLLSCTCCRRARHSGQPLPHMRAFVHVSFQHALVIFFLHREGNESGPSGSRVAIKAKRCISDKSSRTVHRPVIRRSENVYD